MSNFDVPLPPPLLVSRECNRVFTTMQAHYRFRFRQLSNAPASSVKLTSLLTWHSESKLDVYVDISERHSDNDPRVGVGLCLVGGGGVSLQGLTVGKTRFNRSCHKEVHALVFAVAFLQRYLTLDFCRQVDSVTLYSDINTVNAQLDTLAKASHAGRSVGDNASDALTALASDFPAISFSIAYLNPQGQANNPFYRATHLIARRINRNPSLAHVF